MNMKSIPNYNPDFDVYFGIVSARNLDSEIVDLLLFGNPNSVNHTEADAIAELAKEFRVFANPDGTWYVADAEDNSVNLLDVTFPDCPSAIEACDGGYRALENLQIEEPIIEGVYDNTKYISSWLGGALHFFITEARAYTPWAPACSPCVPNAGNLDSWIDGATGNQSAFLPPMSWLSTEAHAAVSRSWREVCIPDGEGDAEE